MSAPAYKRILLKLSGEALAADQGFGVDNARIHEIAAEIPEVHHLASKSPSLSAAETSSAASPSRPRHGPGLRRSHGHAGHRHQCSCPAGRAGKAGRSHPRHDRHRDEPGRRAFYPSPRHAPSGKRSRRRLRRRNRQPIFFDRHRRFPAGHGDQGRRHPEGHQG